MEGGGGGGGGGEKESPNLISYVVYDCGVGNLVETKPFYRMSSCLTMSDIVGPSTVCFLPSSRSDVALFAGDSLVA